jgi:hypothetical protein
MGFFLTAGICDETNCRTGAGFRSAAVPAAFVCLRVTIHILLIFINIFFIGRNSERRASI